MTLALADLGVGTYIHEATSTRYPVYTRGNAGEVWPEVAYPLTISLSRSASDDAFRRAVLATGTTTEADVAEGPSAFGGCFGGYMYLNLSFNRMLAVRAPGVTIEESDATYLGTEGVAPPHVPHPDDKSLRASLMALRYVWKMLRAKSLPHLQTDRQVVDAWRRRLPELMQADDDALVAVSRQMMEPLMELFVNHLDVTGKAGASVQLLSKLCEEQLGDRSLALTMLGSLGDVDSAAPSFALWDLGRMVATDAGLSAHFDAGLEGLAERLLADPGAAGFNGAFAEFLERFGSRGPNEWESACETWGTDHRLPLALVDRMRGAEDRQSPSTRGAELEAHREAAVADARERLRWPVRRIFDRTLRAATMYSQARERSKTTIIDLIHVGRLVARELADRTAARVDGGTREDLWFVLESELDAYVADPATFRETISQRRAAREELKRRVPPFVFEGRLPSPTTWPLRTDESAGGAGPALTVGEHIDGVAACPGIAEGRARIVTDPAQPGDIGPGDVLIAPLTDPSWTPLFVPVEAVVVDVGGQMSHAVIVSRELGLPCVVAATGATARIADGARVRVDGTAGTVTMLEDT